MYDLGAASRQPQAQKLQAQGLELRCAAESFGGNGPKRARKAQSKSLRPEFLAQSRPGHVLSCPKSECWPKGT